MKLTTDQRDVIDGIMYAEHKDGRGSREIAVAVAAAIADLDKFGHGWTEQYRNSLTVIGAMKACADWRRRHFRPAKTAKGTEVSAPEYAGGVDSEGKHVQLRFSGMDAAAIRRRKKQLEAQRNTLSAEVRLLADLLEVMEERSLSTAGEALAILSGVQAA